MEKTEITYTSEEKRFKSALNAFWVLFFAGFVTSAYFIYFHTRQVHLLLLLTPVIMLYFSLLSKIASEGLRKNAAFADLILLSSIVLAVYTLVKFICFIVQSRFILLYLIYASLLLIFFLVTLVLWRKSVISRFELKFLPPTQALSYIAVAEVIIGESKAEGYSFDTIVKDCDKYLSSFKSPQKVSVKLVYFLVQYFPLIFLRLPLTWMGIEDRKEFIKRRFFRSKGMLRDIIKSAKQLVYFIYYSNKPSFISTGYQMFEERKKYGEMPKKPDPKPLDVTYITREREIETDICVIGSGAAGSVAAYHLAKNTRKKVMILERGRYYIPQTDFTNIEPEMIGMLYKDGALALTQDYDLAILQGICVGGSTTINNGICFRTPPEVLKEWESLGAKIDTDKLHECFGEVERIIGAKDINVKETNEGANRFFNGAKELGLKPEWFKTNFEDCGGSGYCNIGCKYNRKLSMLLNYLPMAQGLGAEIIADAEAIKVETNAANTGKIICRTSNGIKFTVKAKHIVIASGTIASSELLLRSGIKRNVGTRLSFNITTPMMAEFSDEVHSFDGIQMCCFVKGNGFLVETTFNPPGASAVVMQGWFETLIKRMNEYVHFATAAPVVGSEPNGKMRKSLLGIKVDYVMTNNDFKKLKDGMKMLSEIFLRAGAKCVLPSSYDELEIKTNADISKIYSLILKPEDISLSTAHPQGGNPLSDNKDIGVVDSNFRVHGFRNLYVCDASIFPTCAKVNPQVSIMGIANYAANVISANI